LHKSEAIFPIGRSSPLGLRCLRRNTTIGWIDNHRGPWAGMLYGQKLRIVGAPNIGSAAARLTRIVAKMRPALSV
jgi:hypothetical protein